jgi:phosphinothricin acetyltransferase
MRLVEKPDYQRVLDILNEAILERIYTAQLTPATMERRKSWFENHSNPRYPMYVLEMDGEIMGWFTLMEFRTGREGFKVTTEISYYLDSRVRGKGYGTKMVGVAVEKAREIGFKNIIAVIFDSNNESKKITQKFGFELWGHLPEVVEIDGKGICCDYWGLKL